MVATAVATAWGPDDICAGEVLVEIGPQDRKAQALPYSNCPFVSSTKAKVLVRSLYLRRPDVPADVQMVAVDLSSNNLTGTLPAVWLDLPQVGFAACACTRMYTDASHHKH